MRTLDVYLNSELIGQIIENRKGGRFEYSKEVVERFAGQPVLSLSLPVKARPFGESKTSNWFNGLLPEGVRREEACNSLDISLYDWIGLLAEIGWECAGAVRIFEHGNKQEYKADYTDITSAELAEKLSNLRTSVPHIDSGMFRMSLGGFQDKLCVAMPAISQNNVYVSATDVIFPIGDAPSTHILKPENNHDYPGVAESEAWAMTVASYATKTSRVALLDIKNAPPTLVVERFDRLPNNGCKFSNRIHQEDICQALGLSPKNKYANTSEPKGSDLTYIAIASLLRKYSDDPEHEIQVLLRQLTTNLALGNWDAHAKNMALLYTTPMIPTLAPLYDVVPVAEIEKRTEFMSMYVDGLIRPEQVRRSNIISEAISWGMNEKVAESIVDNVFTQIEKGVYAASEIYPKAAARHKVPVLKRIEQMQAG